MKYDLLAFCVSLGCILLSNGIELVCMIPKGFYFSLFVLIGSSSSSSSSSNGSNNSSSTYNCLSLHFLNGVI